MGSQTEILNLLIQGPLKPSFIATRLNISRQALHRHLKILLKKNLIKKAGETPHIVYSLAKINLESRIEESYQFFKSKLLPQYLEDRNFQKKYTRFLKKHGEAKSFDFTFMLDSSAVYSSNIEGNTLNLNSFLNSRMLNKRIRPKEAQEIEDLVTAYQLSQTHPFNEKNMLKAHAVLSRDFVNKARQGVYRKEPVGVFSGRGLEYLAIEQELVSNEMLNLFIVIQKLLEGKMSTHEVFFWASWIHLMIVLIHPFSDGNGRISRLCEKWFLFKKLGKVALLLSSEEHYFKNRPRYYAALKLGVNYWEVNYKKASAFLDLLPEAL